MNEGPIREVPGDHREMYDRLTTMWALMMKHMRSQYDRGFGMRLRWRVGAALLPQIVPLENPATRQYLFEPCVGSSDDFTLMGIPGEFSGKSRPIDALELSASR